MAKRARMGVQHIHCNSGMSCSNHAAEVSQILFVVVYLYMIQLKSEVMLSGSSCGLSRCHGPKTMFWI
jgi:hypothetical protein